MCERECGCDVIIEMLDMLVFVLSLGEISFRSTILKSEIFFSGFTLLKSEIKEETQTNLKHKTRKQAGRAGTEHQKILFIL